MAVSSDQDGVCGELQRRRRRRWSASEKRRIVAESDAPGASVSRVARRYDLNANLLFTWRRKYRRQREAGAEQAAFAPVVISPTGAPADRDAASAGAGAPHMESRGARPASGVMEIVLAGGGRVIVDVDVNAAALARVLDVLERPAACRRCRGESE